MEYKMKKYIRGNRELTEEEYKATKDCVTIEDLENALAEMQKPMRKKKAGIKDDSAGDI